MIGVFKSAFRKEVGNSTLTWRELSEVVLDVEVAINDRPLSYIEEDIQLPVLTPSSMLYLRPNQLPELDPHHIKETDLRKRAKYLGRCKEAMWSCPDGRRSMCGVLENGTEGVGENGPHIQPLEA